MKYDGFSHQKNKVLVLPVIKSKSMLCPIIFIDRTWSVPTGTKKMLSLLSYISCMAFRSECIPLKVFRSLYAKKIDFWTRRHPRFIRYLAIWARTLSFSMSYIMK